MQAGIQSLTEREKQTLRLLLAGHEAKSIARELDLSIHTVNERLRDVRRRTGASSSREAARMLAAAESGGDDRLGDKELGVAAVAPEAPLGGQPGPRSGRGPSPALLWGGLLTMCLVIAAAAFALATQPASNSDDRAPATTASNVSAPFFGKEEMEQAQAWMRLMDDGKWEESWNDASPLFRSQLSAAQWATALQSARQPLGAVRSRTLIDATTAATLPGAPAGQYLVLHFRTEFAHKDDAVETVTLRREGGAWKPAGYFIR